MTMTYAYSALVHPASSAASQLPMTQAVVDPSVRLFDMLTDIFERAGSECNIDLVFTPDANGAQNNSCRAALMAFIRNPSFQTGEIVARRLQSFTPPQAGVALLFLLVGVNHIGYHRLVVSRFPAETGILAQENGQILSLSLIEQVFLKNAFAYKSAYFTTEDIAAEFQGGSAMDRQSRDTGKPARYWVQQFLESELLTTDAGGTMFLGKALDAAVKHADDFAVKNELLSASTIMRGFDGVAQSTADMLETLRLSAPAVQAIRSHLSRPEAANDVFTFSTAEFDKHIRYQTVELNNGATMTAPNGDFSDVFSEEIVSDDGRVRFTTEGYVVDRRIRRAK